MIEIQIEKTEKSSLDRFDGSTVEKSIAKYLEKSNFPKNIILKNIIREIKMNIRTHKDMSDKYNSFIKQISNFEKDCNSMKMKNLERINNIRKKLSVS